MRKPLFVFFALFVFFVWFKAPLSADNDPNNIANQIKELEAKVNELGKQEKTLKEQVDYMDSQTRLTSLRLEEVKKKLEDLEGSIVTIADKIVMVEEALSKLAEVLARRIVATYAYADVEPFELFLGKGGFNEFLNRYKYLQVIQLYDKKLLYQMQATKNNYRDQKGLLEVKQEEALNLKKKMERYKQELAQQKKDKESLLLVTRNDEKRYQSLLEQARQELQSLLSSAFTGKRHVNKGDVIGLMGDTGFSRGAHLHFGVYDLKEADIDKFDYFSNHQDPFSYLAGKSVTFKDGSCDGIGSDQTKNIGGGSHDWPMNNPKISQCYGHTPYSWVYKGNFHQGIDMFNIDDLAIRAIDEGEAYFYRGQGSFGNNVRIFHPNGKMTLYLHMQ